MRCENPFSDKETGYQFPCGRCLNCKKKRVSEWSFRLRKQAEVSASAFFVTYTYDNDNVPIVKAKWPMTLQKRDMQLYFKKLRKTQKEKISYYGVGEYGGERMRPHYHVLLFDVPLTTLIGQKMAKIALKEPDIYLKGKFHFEHELWGKGTITIGQVEQASIGYCLEYIHGQHKTRSVPLNPYDKRAKESSFMSKGIGANYLTEKVKKWHRADILNRVYGQIEDGKKVALARYYKERLFTQTERIEQALHFQTKAENNYNKMTKEQQIKSYERALSLKQENARKVLAYKSLKNKEL